MQAFLASCRPAVVPFGGPAGKLPASALPRSHAPQQRSTTTLLSEPSNDRSPRLQELAAAATPHPPPLPPTPRMWHRRPPGAQHWPCCPPLQRCWQRRRQHPFLLRRRSRRLVTAATGRHPAWAHRWTPRSPSEAGMGRDVLAATSQLAAQSGWLGEASGRYKLHAGRAPNLAAKLPYLPALPPCLCCPLLQVFQDAIWRACAGASGRQRTRGSGRRCSARRLCAAVSGCGGLAGSRRSMPRRDRCLCPARAPLPPRPATQCCPA